MPIPDPPWWRRGVIYQIAVSSFADSDGDGRGDLRGIIERLDYLNDGTPASLGVDAIWLTPITGSLLRDFGYDVSDYRSINPRFGTMTDFEDLLAECHKRGIRVIMDLALNHTSDEHPWFLESRSSRDNPKRDWYVWRDGKAFRRPPNRWRAVIEGSAWTRDPRTGQFYYHAFLPFQPDLNWRNPAVRDEMFSIARFWLDKGVDGFRLDLINFLYEDEQLRNNPLQPGWHPYGWQRHLHDRSQPESFETVRALRRLTDGYPDRALLGEVYTDRPEDCLACLGDGTDALHLAFYLNFATRWWHARDYRRAVEWLEAHIPPSAWPCYYLNNHDLPRTYSRLSRRNRRDAEPRAKIAAAMLLTLRGTPIIYYGEEIGMPTSHLPRREFDDPVGRRTWPLPLGRDGSRTPMQWTAEEGAGFTLGEPWLPVDGSHAVRNVTAERDDPQSLLAWYRQLIRLRAETPALREGSYRTIPGTPKDVFAYMREADGQRVAVFLNFAGRVRDIGGCLRVDKGADRGAKGDAGADAGTGRTWLVLLSTRRPVEEEFNPDAAQLDGYEVLIVRQT